MEDILTKYKMKINSKKTKVMKCHKTEARNSMNINLGADKLEECNEFCYLGSVITKDNRSKRDIMSRIAQAKKAFAEKRQLMTSCINLDTRKKFFTHIYGV